MYVKILLAIVVSLALYATHYDPPPILTGTTYADVINPAYDYIPPELISLFVTDIGACTPSYIYRLLTEYYSRQDYVLSNTVLGGLVR